MAVGGNIIEMQPMTITAGDYPGRPTEVVRLWCMDRRSGDETRVYAKPADVMPKIGDKVWWQSGLIFFDDDKQSLRKIAYSFAAPGTR